MSYNTVDEMFQTIRDILLKTIPNIQTENLDENTDLYEVGLDSINSVNFAMAIEEQYNITFKDEHILGQNFATIGRIKQLLKGEYIK
ncbi:MAG: phosphopantetheine-binding protein [Caulobacteraceae bacterium]